MKHVLVDVFIGGRRVLLLCRNVLICFLSNSHGNLGFEFFVQRLISLSNSALGPVGIWVWSHLAISDHADLRIHPLFRPPSQFPVSSQSVVQRGLSFGCVHLHHTRDTCLRSTSVG